MPKLASGQSPQGLPLQLADKAREAANLNIRHVAKVCVRDNLFSESIAKPFR